MQRSNYRTILLVDDEPYTLEALRRVFRNEPYRLLATESSAAALDVMETESVDLVIADYNMSGMLGTELLKEIHDTWPDTIRIMLTGQAHIQTIMLGVSQDIVYKFITKPWDNNDLLTTVKRALEHLSLKLDAPK